MRAENEKQRARIERYKARVGICLGIGIRRAHEQNAKIKEENAKRKEAQAQKSASAVESGQKR